MKKKLKCYVLILSRFFPATHPRKGEPTNFLESIETGKKIHTIRMNYDLWEKRIKEVQEGKAYISIRYWEGKPYNSKQLEVFRFDNTHGIGVEKLEMTPLGWFVTDYDSDYTSKDFAKNDGLVLQDFYDWFRGKITIDMVDPMVIIHFTKFRYQCISK